MAEILEVDVVMDSDNLKPTLLPVLQQLRPEWKHDDIVTEELKGGNLNRVFTLTNPSQPEDVLAVRLFCQVSAAMDHGSEYVLLKFLHKTTDLVKMYCKLNNGYIYKYFLGRCCGTEDLLNESVRRKVCEKLHQLHSVQLEPALSGSPVLKYDANLKTIQRSLDDLKSDAAVKLDENERLIAAGLPRDVLVRITEETIQEYQTIMQGYPPVLCHGDAQINNIITNEQSGAIEFIDWDLISVTGEIIDLVVLLSRDSRGGMQELQMYPYQDEKPLNKWLMTYLETHPKYRESGVQKEIFLQWRRSLLKSCEVMSKWLGCCALAAMVTCSDNKFDGFEVIIACLEDAKEYKNILEQMK